MMRLKLCGPVMAFAYSAIAQTGWQSVMPDTFHCHNLNQLYVDEATDRLLAPGITSFAPNDGGFQIVPYYDGSAWGYYGTFNYGTVNSTIRFGDTLLFAGSFESVDSLPYMNIVGHVGNTWIPFGQFSDATINRLSIVDGELYALGTFRYADSTECWGLAKRHGGRWVNVGSRYYPAGLEPNLFDICSYQGKLVVAGLITPINGLGPNIIQFNGTDWENVGNGITGCAGSISALAVYNGELYVGGGLMVGAGAVGHGIVRWNGSEWRDVGGNLHDLVNSTNYNASANSFLVHDGTLYVGGSFSYAGGLEANRFAIWDGSSWCVTGDSVDTRVQTMAIYHDTLYVNCRDHLHWDTSNYVARWSGGPLEDTCAWAVAVPEADKPNMEFHVYRSQQGRLTCNGLPNGRYSLAIFSAAGQLLVQQVLEVIGGSGAVRSISPSHGIYLVVVTDGERQWSNRLVVDP